jgi:GTPase
MLIIFGQRAHTREGRLQVELAQIEYDLPRLARQWGTPLPSKGQRAAARRGRKAARS